MPSDDYDADATELVETYDFLMKYIVIGKPFFARDFKTSSNHTL
ncbi:hypothetical protein EST38_g5993 [Candolleomyces aberdarensis]|uniref:Uncharacterized protein n=1 Tax=Candolleomyces aberdarensis TaxID=2316362 RepID=A0A4Q2DJ67_9AGAR|nr:hypothetical protein EST38_g5993 [Candolleomyces aberdarensis]